MSADTRSIDYAALIESALRDVICDLLRRVAEAGLPGAHHFYLSFDTSHPDVVLSRELRQQYPEEMTVVLQHQYRDLEVDGESLTVTLQFSGLPERITIPFEALTAFADPEAEFGLRFQRLEEELRAGGVGDQNGSGSDGDAEGITARAQVVQLDDFRKG